VIAAALAAACLAGCGGGGSKHTQNSASAAASSTPLPSGFARYRAYGFTFAAPSDFKVAPGSVPGLPPGASAQTLTPNGQSPGVANTIIFEGYNPNLQQTIDQVAANLRQADATNPAQTGLQTSVSSVNVPGAQAARMVTESYISDNPHTLYKRTWLMVLPKPGLLMDLVVVTEPERGATLDPSTVLNSFRLGG
jgi:hypothetical protein